MRDSLWEMQWAVADAVVDAVGSGSCELRPAVDLKIRCSVNSALTELKKGRRGSHAGSDSRLIRRDSRQLLGWQERADEDQDVLRWPNSNST